MICFFDRFIFFRFVLVGLFCALPFQSVLAQEFISYQAYLKEFRTVNQPGNNLNASFPIVSESVQFEFAFLVNGATIYEETDTLVTDEDGLIFTRIGQKNPADFSGIRWDLIRDDVLLTVKWKKLNEMNYRSVDSLDLGSSPYSFSSLTSLSSLSAQNGIKSIRKENLTYIITLVNDSSFQIETLRLPPSAIIIPNGSPVGCAGDSVTLSSNYIVDPTLQYTWQRNGLPLSNARKFSAHYPPYPLVDTIVLSVTSNIISYTSRDTLVLKSFLTPSRDSILTLMRYSLGNVDSFCPGQVSYLPRIAGGKWFVSNNSAEIRYSSSGSLDTLFFKKEGLVRLNNVSTGNCPNSVFSYDLFCIKPFAKLLSNSPFEFCDNSLITINAAYLPGFRYVWFKNNALIPNETKSSLTTSSEGRYRVAVFSNSCADTSEALDLVLNHGPVFDLRLIGGTNFCLGSSVVLKASKNPYFRYFWNVNGSTLTNYFSDSLIVDSTSTVFLTVRNDDRCKSVSDTFRLTVDSVASFSISSNRLNNRICSNDTIKLLTQPQANSSYQWFRNDILIPNATNPSYETQIVGNYKIRIRNALNCERFSNLLTVQVADTPFVALGSNNRPTTFCSGDSVRLTATNISNPSDSSTYSWWYNGNSFIKSERAVNSSLVVYDPGQYRVIVTNAQGCSSRTGSILVQVLLEPQAGTLSGNDSICVNATTPFASTASGGAWSSSDTLVATVNASTGLVTGVGAGTATITYTVTGTGGCSNATATRTVTVNPFNTVSLNPGGNNYQLINIGDSIIPIAYSTTGATGATISGLPPGVTGSWANNIVTISGTPLTTGTFNYTVTMTGGCTGGNNIANGTIEVINP